MLAAVDQHELTACFCSQVFCWLLIFLNRVVFLLVCWRCAYIPGVVVISL